jgi:hypothetical protein
MAGLWFDRPIIRPPEARPDDARVARAKRERIKFRLVQTLVLLAAILFADAVMTEGRVRRDLAAQAGSVLTAVQDEARRLGRF